MQRITPRIHFLSAQEEGDRPVLGHIQGDRYTLMVDAGNGADHVRLYNQSIAQAGLPAPDFAAITHWHWDHTFGMHALACPSLACAQTNRYLADVMGWEWTEEAMAKRLASGEDNEFCDREIRNAYPDRSTITVRQSDIAFVDSLTLDLGGIHCELRRVECPHSADSVLAFIPEEGMLFVGDAGYEGSHHGRRPLYKAKLAGFIAVLERINFTRCLTGHGELQTKDELLAELQSDLLA